VTFLIFLLSVAVLEHLLGSDAGAKKDLPSRTLTGIDRVTSPPLAGTSGLHNLSHILEEHGRGVTPELETPEPDFKNTK
jgi:hypothetical protein